MTKPRSTLKLRPEEKYRLDYEQTAAYFHELAGVRFKLLAIVPIVTGAAIALLDADVQGSARMAVAVLGLLATVGVMFYDQRNNEIYDSMQKRAKMLEAILQFERWDETKKCGGAFLDRPRRGRRFFGVQMWGDLGLAIIYSSAISAWAYLLVHAVPLPVARLAPSVAAVFVWLFVFYGLIRLDDPADEREAMPPDVRPLIWGDDENDDEDNQN